MSDIAQLREWQRHVWELYPELAGTTAEDVRRLAKEKKGAKRSVPDTPPPLRRRFRRAEPIVEGADASED